MTRHAFVFTPFWTAATARRSHLASSVLALLFVLTLTTGLASAQSSTAVVGSATALRDRADASAATSDVLQVGATVTLLRRDGQWWLVTTTSGRQGYVHERFLRVEGAAAPQGTAPAPSTPSPEVRRPAATPSASPSGGMDAQVFGDAGILLATSKVSATAVFGSERFTAFGGGASAAFGPIFVQASYRRSSRTGERVVVVDDEAFGLGIPTTLVMQPFNLTVGYKFRGSRFRPYAGGGLTMLSVEETSPFAGDDDVDERFTGAHALAGADVQVMSWLAVGAEVEYSSVKTTLENSGALGEFGEDDLGGWAVRARVSFGLFGRR